MRMGVRSVSQLRHIPDNTSGRRVTTRSPFAPVINNAPGAGHDESAIARAAVPVLPCAYCTGSGASACAARGFSFSSH
jgi:hypothetical protein